MNEIEIRSSAKFVWIRATVALFLVLVAWGSYFFGPLKQAWVAGAISLLLFWPLIGWLKLRSTVTYLGADALRSETGVMGRSTRNLMLTRIQDVGVTQSFQDRLFGVGDVWIESAGASSRIVLTRIDSPKRVANQILDAARLAGH